jgi:hypothetical protein
MFGDTLEKIVSPVNGVILFLTISPSVLENGLLMGIVAKEVTRSLEKRSSSRVLRQGFAGAAGRAEKYFFEELIVERKPRFCLSD